MSSPEVKIFNGHPAVRVARWPGGVSLWRTNLDTGSRTFEFRSSRSPGEVRHCVCERADREELVFWVPSRVYPRGGKATSAWPYLRWAMVELGFVRVGERLPFGERPSPSDPFVGRFSAETREEVLLQLRELDRQLSLASPGSIRSVSDLFANDAMLWIYRLGKGVDLEVQQRDSLETTPVSLDRRRLDSVESALPWLMGEMSYDASFVTKKDVQDFLSWLLLPGEEADRWWAEHTVVGELDLPAEEVESYRLLGEDLPFLWRARQLLDWVTERGGRP